MHGFGSNVLNENGAEFWPSTEIANVFIRGPCSFSRYRGEYHGVFRFRFQIPECDKIGHDWNSTQPGLCRRVDCGNVFVGIGHCFPVNSNRTRSFLFCARDNRQRCLINFKYYITRIYINYIR